MVERAELVGAVRQALVDLLIQGSWDSIEADHQRVGLKWRPDLKPRWGKPKYVAAVLRDLSEADLLGLAGRCMEVLLDRPRSALQDALWWLEAEGIAELSEITRRALARQLEGRVIARDENLSVFLARITGMQHALLSSTLAYGADGFLYEEEVDLAALLTGTHQLEPTFRRRHVAPILEEYGLLRWPDKRAYGFLEQLVHPTVRRETAEQEEWVTFLNQVIDADGIQLVQTGRISKRPVFSVHRRASGVGRKLKNLIFASKGPKPELGFQDAMNNDVVILRHAEHCLIYEEAIGDEGLPWSSLVAWWARRQGGGAGEPAARRALGNRLLESLGSPVERTLFKEYFRQFAEGLGDRLPALLPQSTCTTTRLACASSRSAEKGRASSRSEWTSCFSFRTTFA